MNRERPTFCGKDCGANACPLLVTVDGDRALRLRANPAGGPYLKPCPRGYILHRAHHAPDRLKAPLVAAGPRGSRIFREASWDEALDLVADRLADIRRRHGGNSVLAMGGAGSTGAFHDSAAQLARFMNALRPAGTGPEEAATFLSSSYSNGAARFVLPYLYGQSYGESGFDASTVLDAKLIVLWGANPLEARLGAELDAYLREAAIKGIPIVCIDPRRTKGARELGAQWLAIRPGTDAALMLALLREFYALGVDRARIRELAVGMDELEAYVDGRADGTERGPDWAEGITGVPAARARALARAWLEAKPTMLLPGYSIQRVRGGEDAYRLTAALQIASGHFGRRGGSTGSINNRLPKPRVGSLSKLARGDEPAAPVLRWPDLILEGRGGGYASAIAAAYVCGANYLNQGADARKAARALGGLEFSVCHELFLTPTAALCDVVLPAASPLEKEDVGIPWAGAYLLYKPKAIEPAGPRDDYAIFSGLAERLGAEDRFTEGKTASDWVERFIAGSEVPDAAAFKSTGVYIAPDERRPGLEAFAADPKARPLPTPSGRVEILSAAYVRDTGCPALPLWESGAGRAKPAAAGPEVGAVAPSPGSPFILVTPKTIRRTHSQDGGGAAWTGSRADCGELSVHPADGAFAGLIDGGRALVSNEQGSTMAAVRFDEGIMRGVACLHEGAWLDPAIALSGKPAGAATTAADPSPPPDPNGSANLLSSTDGSGPATAPAMHGIQVFVGPLTPARRRPRSR